MNNSSRKHTVDYGQVILRKIPLLISFWFWLMLRVNNLSLGFKGNQILIIKNIIVQPVHIHKFHVRVIKEMRAVSVSDAAQEPHHNKP